MMRPLKIMIVDDDKTTLDVVGAVLEKEGHEVVLQPTALGTLLVVRREKPDVVLLDVRMPGLSGDRLAALIAQGSSDQHPLVILHSSSTLEELFELARTAGAVGVIEKTGNTATFLRQFEKLVGPRLPAVARKRASPAGWPK